MDVYVRECREAKAWRELREVLHPRWRELQGTLAMIQSVVKSLRVDTADRDAFKETWDRTLAPLVEACLRLGDEGTADNVLDDALRVFQSKNLPIWASELALRCGQPGVAQRWAALKVPEATR